MCKGCPDQLDLTITQLSICKKLTHLSPLMVNLICLHANYSNLEEIPKTLVNLRSISCGGTRIKSIPPELINLESLWCYETEIDHIPSILTKLVYLYCSKINIREIPNTLTNLHSLICDYTMIEEIPNTLHKLKVLDVRCCKNITKLPLLPNLELLDIGNTNIKYVPGYAKLETLFCSYSSLNDISIESRNSLKRLHCYQTELKQIDLSTFKNQVRLRTCTCIKIKLDDRMPSIRKRYDCKKDIKQIRLIQQVYRRYRFKRNLAIWIKLHLPFDLYRLVKSY